MEEKTPGLLLQSIPYLGKKKILKVFTPEGLVSLFAKNTKLTPFCVAEWVYEKTQKEIYSLKDTSLIDPLTHLRQDYQVLTTAGAIAKDLLRTQMPDKKAPELYQLAYLYLQKLPISPKNLAASFKLKLLLHEGLLSCEQEPLFTTSEWEQVCALAFSRKLTEIYALTTTPCEKIALLFEQRLIHS